MLIRYILSGVLAYLLGSVSTGVLISRAAFHDDVRTHGSGSAGTTNILRNYSKAAAVGTFLGDFIKGVAAVLIGLWLAGRMGGYLGAFCVLLGHLFPLYFGFRGGKGMATAAGTILALYPIVLPFVLVPWLLLVALTRYVSIGSITAAILYPVATYFWCGSTGTDLLWPMLLSITTAVLLVFMHRANIGRLIKGKENRLGHHAAPKEAE